MKIEIYSDINSYALKEIWQDLEKKSCCFPQSRWSWCSVWWNNLGSRKEVRIYVAYDENDVVVALAPFIIDTLFGIKCLRSMPENYGDYFDFVISPSIMPDICYAAVLSEILKSRDFSAVLLFNVNTRCKLSEFIESSEKSVLSKTLVKTISMDINTGTYDGYLQSLSKNRRGYIRKKQRALESEFKIESVFSKSEDVYLSVFDETFEIQKLRWGTTRPRRSHEYMQAVRDSNSELFRDSLMAFLGIRANGRLISYRLGFIHENCFYDWNTSYDPGFEKFSPGALSIAYLVEKLIDEGVHKIDFMAGYYDYKLSYSPDPRIYENKLYVLCGSSLKARFVAWYFLYGRDKAKQVYSRIRDYRLVKWIRS